PPPRSPLFPYPTLFRSLDWYPLGYAFHLSPGLLIYNGNGATATASVPGGSTFTLGGVTYTSDPSNPITGSGKVDFMKAAPTAMVDRKSTRLNSSHDQNS